MRVLSDHPAASQPIRFAGTHAEAAAAPAGDLARPTMPKAVQDLLRDPAALEVAVSQAAGGAKQLGEVFGNAIRYRFTGSGPLSGREIVPETAASQELLDGPRGAAIRDSIRGVLEVLEKRDQPVKLTGLTMSPGSSHFLSNILISDAEAAAELGEPVDAQRLQMVAQELQDAGIGNALGVYDFGGWMHIDPSSTKEFVERIAAGPNAPVTRGELVATLQHELEHSVTPSLADGMDQLRWLEEATAEVLTQWDGAIEEMANGMKVRQTSSGQVAYPEQTERLNGWIRRAGLDPSSSGDLAGARDLLQGAKLQQVPDRIAEAIVRNEGTGDAGKLAGEIKDDFRETDRFLQAGPHGGGFDVAAVLDMIASLNAAR